MKSFTPEIIKSGTLCYCWKLTLSDSTSYGFTDHDEPLTFDGLTYEASSGWTSSAIESNLGLKVDNLEVSGALSSDRIAEGDIDGGKFDGAEILIYRVNWKNPSQVVLLRRASIGEITRNAHGFRVELRGLAHKLAHPQGRTYHRLCDADFTDKRCRASFNSFRKIGTVHHVEQKNQLIVSTGFSNYVPGYFSLGEFIFTTGSNKGFKTQVRVHTIKNSVGVFLLWDTPPYRIGSSNQFSILAGCDKTYNTCKDKFRNQLNFQGFPHLPGNDYIQYYPRS